MKSAALGLLLCCFLPSAYAADAKNAYSIRGVEVLTCEAYLQERGKQSNTNLVIGGWLDGYVTGMNRFAPDTYDALSFETTEFVAGLMEEHCKSNPTHRLFGVVQALLARLHDDRIRASSPRVNVKSGEQEFAMYSEVLQRVQRKLTALGLYQGALEPEFGEKTRQALSGFQGKNNLKVTGLPDQPTLWLLLRQFDSPK